MNIEPNIELNIEPNIGDNLPWSMHVCKYVCNVCMLPSPLCGIFKYPYFLHYFLGLWRGYLLKEPQGFTYFYIWVYQKPLRKGEIGKWVIGPDQLEALKKS